MAKWSIFSREPSSQKRTSESLHMDELEGNHADVIAKQMELMKQGRRITGVLQDYKYTARPPKKGNGR
jgi:hypothetical protein